MRKELKGIAGKARAQITKDYIAWPLISGGVMTLIELAVIAAKTRDERTASGCRTALPARCARPSASRAPTAC